MKRERVSTKAQKNQEDAQEKEAKAMEIKSGEQLENLEYSEEEASNYFEECMSKVKGYGLSWTFRSIDYILNTEGVSFGQLRSCVYIKEGNAYFNYLKSTLLIIKAGLVGSQQIKPTDTQALEDRAYEIAEDWRATYTSVNTLHLLLIHIMETKHFFMDSGDQKIIQHLSSKNFVKDLALNLIREDLEEKTRQAQALRGNL